MRLTQISDNHATARLVMAAVSLLSVLNACSFSPDPATYGAPPWRRGAPSPPAADWRNGGCAVWGGPGACPRGGGWGMPGGRHHHSWGSAGRYGQMPPADGNVADLPAPQSPGATLVNQYCAQCHARPSPQQHTAAEWPAVVSRMREHMQAMSNLGVTPTQQPSAAEVRDIIAYLQTFAS